jgi:hypothetical protein
MTYYRAFLGEFDLILYFVDVTTITDLLDSIWNGKSYGVQVTSPRRP